MSSREAAKTYSIGFSTWQRIKTETNFVPATHRRSDRDVTRMAATILEHVKAVPHINTAARAKILAFRTEDVQKVLAEHGLSKLDARLRDAGYQVDVLRPLQVARQRRIVATGPGTITHVDYKAFGFLRGVAPRKGIRVGGYVCVDSLTGFATVLLTDRTNPEDATAAVEKHRRNSPFELKGIIFSDNGPTDFLSDHFIEFCAKNGWLQRTTRYNSPWSNGKVEALNKTLKYQCFPAIAAANVTQWIEVVQLVDAWMEFYNTKRSHTGHVNKGLPPKVWYDLWCNTPGTPLEKLTALGVLPVDKGWVLSIMGGAGNAEVRPVDGGRSNGRPLEKDGLPYAFVLQRDRSGEFVPRDGSDGTAIQQVRSPSKTSFVLAK